MVRRVQMLTFPFPGLIFLNPSFLIYKIKKRGNKNITVLRVDQDNSQKRKVNSTIVPIHSSGCLSSAVNSEGPSKGWPNMTNTSDRVMSSPLFWLWISPSLRSLARTDLRPLEVRSSHPNDVDSLTFLPPGERIFIPGCCFYLVMWVILVLKQIAVGF